MRDPNYLNTILLQKQEKIKVKVRKRVAQNLYMEKNPNALLTLSLKKKKDQASK